MVPLLPIPMSNLKFNFPHSNASKKVCIKMKASKTFLDLVDLRLKTKNT